MKRNKQRKLTFSRTSGQILTLPQYLGDMRSETQPKAHYLADAACDITVLTEKKNSK